MSRHTFHRNMGKVMSNRIVAMESTELDTLTGISFESPRCRFPMRVDSRRDLTDNRATRWSRNTVQVIFADWITGMHTTRLISLAILLASALAMPVSLADEELRWRGYSLVDEATTQVVYGVTKSYIVNLKDGRVLERRIGFRCNDDQPILTLDLDEFLAASSSDFELLIWIDDFEPLVLDMRVWSNGTNGGYSRIEVVAKELFEQMRAGIRLLWRLGGTANRNDGNFSLIGFTSASREFAASCSL